MDLVQQTNNNVITINVKLSSFSTDPIKSMWTAARNCYYRGDFCDLEKTFDHSKAVDLLRRITKKGHLSILEQCFFQFQISGISRSCMAQFTRHRVGWTFAVQSQHYQKHDDFTFKDLEKYIDSNHQKEYYKLMETINNFYKKSINNKIPKFIAREVLPNATSVHLVAAANLASLKHFWALRIPRNNTPEIRKMAFMMYNTVIEKFPDIKEILQTDYEL